MQLDLQLCHLGIFNFLVFEMTLAWVPLSENRLQRAVIEAVAADGVRAVIEVTKAFMLVR